MELLRKATEFCRNHYEKLLLILALIGLAAAVLYLNYVRQVEAGKTITYLQGSDRVPNKPLRPIDSTGYAAALQAAEKPPALDFSLPHNLFNPVKWQRKPDGSLIKIQTGQEVGPAVMVIAKQTDLYFIISLDRVAGAGNYYLGVTREAAPEKKNRGRILRFTTLNATNEFFILREIQGPLEDPTNMVVELPESHEHVSVSKENPHKRVEGFEVDLKYPPEGKTFARQRIGDKLRFGGDEYKIVAITSTEVVLSASSNDKPYTVRKRE